MQGATFRALKEVSDVLAEGDSNARQEFDGVIGEVEEDLDTWASLADTEEERRQVEEVRAVYERVVQDTNEILSGRGRAPSRRAEPGGETARGPARSPTAGTAHAVGATR